MTAQTCVMCVRYLGRYAAAADCASRTTVYRSFSCAAHQYSNPDVMFFGTDEFALPALHALNQLYSSPQTTGWRPGSLRVVVGCEGSCVVRRYANQHALAVSSWNNVAHGASAINAHVGVVVSFGHLLPKRLIDAFSYGVYNVHASLLPRWRGAAPIGHAIRHGDAYTGVTVLHVSPHKFDHGAVLARRSVVVPTAGSGGVDVRQLTSSLAAIGAPLLVQCLSNLAQVTTAAQPQCQWRATYAGRRMLADHAVDWRWCCVHVLRHCRSLPEPATAAWRGARVRLHDVQLPDGDGAETRRARPPCGALMLCRRRRALLVRCLDGWLHVLRLQPTGRATMSGSDFYNGFVSRVPWSQRGFDLVTL